MPGQIDRKEEVRPGRGRPPGHFATFGYW